MDDFIFNDDDILRVLREHRKPIRNIVNNTEKKDIGDRVIVLDYSSVSHLNGAELDDTDYENIEYMKLNDEYYIVIDIRKKVEFKRYFQDMVIVNPKTNEQFRVVSRHLRIYRRF